MAMIHENNIMQETAARTSEIPSNKYKISIEYDEVVIHYHVNDEKQGPDQESMLIHTISSIEVGGRVLSQDEVENIIERSEEESMWAEQDKDFDSPFYPLYEAIPYESEEFKDVEYIRNKACIAF